MNEAVKALNARLNELKKMLDEYKQDMRTTQNAIDGISAQIADVERGLDSIQGTKR